MQPTSGAHLDNLLNQEESSTLRISGIADSAETWADAKLNVEHQIPPGLEISASKNPIARAKKLWQRHQIRREMSNQVYEELHNPVRGFPVASSGEVWQFLKALIVRHKVMILAIFLASSIASFSSLTVPKLLGILVDLAAQNLDLLVNRLTPVLLIAVVAVLANSLFNFLSEWLAVVLGQTLLAEAREKIVDQVLKLPLSKVENASTGDLVTRVTRDASNMQHVIKFAAPQFFIALITCGFIFVAMLVNSPVLTIPMFFGLLVDFFAAKYYMRDAAKGYVCESSNYGKISSTMTEMVEGSATVETLQLEDQRIAISDTDIELTAQNERYTATLRNILFVFMDLGAIGPLIGLVIFGAFAYSQGWVSLGAITAAVVYTQMLAVPLDMLIFTLNSINTGLASTARLVGILKVTPEAEPKGETPLGAEILVEDVHFAYREDHDVLHGINLAIRPGERLAIVGPSGSGKSTLGRLIAGINRPRTGRVTIGGADVSEIALEQLRTQVLLVTQEHHIFSGSIRDNIVLAASEGITDDQVWQALTGVEAGEWVKDLAEGLDTKVGAGNYELTPAQSQQIALARLLVSNPHTLVLDEATSLIDPGTARSLEKSMLTVLGGRTVIAIAHRLHTAHDADRIAVMIDGQIAELGSHEELLKRGGEYAKLWKTWVNEK